MLLEEGDLSKISCRCIGGSTTIYKWRVKLVEKYISTENK